MADRDCYLIQILLPLADNEGRRFGEEPFGTTRAELTARFGGLTAHMQSPVRGLWKTEDGGVAKDDIVIFEVMAPSLDAGWWHDYRGRLEARFRQDTVIVRAMALRVL